MPQVRRQLSFDPYMAYKPCTVSIGLRLAYTRSIIVIVDQMASMHPECEIIPVEDKLAIARRPLKDRSVTISPAQHACWFHLWLVFGLVV